jgi:hypothetical protein
VTFGSGLAGRHMGGGVPEQGRGGGGAVIAFAGRRTLDDEALVRRHLAELFAAERATALVCSAACGADLVALEEAERLGVRWRIVLPFAAARFRETSVTDRPGNWGEAFDRVTAAASAAGDLVTLNGDPEAGDGAYAAANEAILREAQSLARPQQGGSALPLIAVIVWEGTPRSGNDATEGFRTLAAEAGFDVREILIR